MISDLLYYPFFLPVTITFILDVLFNIGLIFPRDPNRILFIVGPSFTSMDFILKVSSANFRLFLALDTACLIVFISSTAALLITIVRVEPASLGNSTPRIAAAANMTFLADCLIAGDSAFTSTIVACCLLLVAFILSFRHCSLHYLSMTPKRPC